ncbi:MAG: hypothetical protein ACFHVJ_00385 [Aestuariibacter sp.]
MHGELAFPLHSVELDSRHQFFLPEAYVAEFGADDVALKRFIEMDLFAFRDGELLPQSDAFQQVLSFAKDYLKTDAQKLESLHFHNHVHTFHPVKGVIAVALKLAILDGIPCQFEGYERIGLAAALHDIGNIVQRQRHEQISVNVSRDLLVDLGYQEDMIRAVSDCIICTAIDFSTGIPQRVVCSREAKILSDADLNNPGFSDVSNFAFESIKLWWELDFFNIKDYPTKGVELTKKFFSDIGDYYTDAARYLFSPIKRQNMAALQAEVSRIMQQCQFDYDKLELLIKENDSRFLI